MRLSILPVAILLVPTIVLGQSLGDAAQKEKDRRKQVEAKASPAPVFGDDSLHQTKGQIASDPGAPVPAPDRVQTPQATGNEAQWRDRFKKVMATLAQAKDHLQKTQSMVVPQRAGGSPAGREIDKAKADLAAAEKALEDLQEEARQAGVPPGWVRP
jgi:hypothetical protein